MKIITHTYVYAHIPQEFSFFLIAQESTWQLYRYTVDCYELTHS